MSISSSKPGGSGALDERRLRAVLRLILASERVDAIAERILAADDSLAEFNLLAGDLTRERHFSRFIALLPGGTRNARSRHTIDVPETVSIRAILALLAQVGLNVDGERLEDAFGIDSQELGLQLLHARSAFRASPLVTCREFGWVVGLYRDRTLATEERVRLLSHATGCDSCREALDQAQQADATLLAALDSELERLPERDPTVRSAQRRRQYGPAALSAGLVGILIMLVVGVSAIGGLISPPDKPVPLFTGEAMPLAPLDGWLLQVSPVGYLEGVDLKTGQKRGLDSGDSTGNFSPSYRVSRTHIAAWRPSDGQRDDVLTIGPIGEQVDFRLTWNRQFVYWYPSTWLDDDTLLIVKSPEHISGETEQQYIERLATQSTLIAFDAVTGTEQVLMTGNVAAAYPSPDGTVMAILHPFDRRFPGSTLELRRFDGRSVGEPIVEIEHRIVGEGFWLADSSRYVTAMITDESIRMEVTPSRRSLADYGVRSVALVGIARDGASATLAVTETPETIVPVAASPDGASIVYQVRSESTESRFAGVPAYDWRCYRLAVGGGEPVLLTEGSSPERIFKPTWSPDGSTLILPVARSFPLSSDGSIDQPVNPNATTLLVFQPGWEPGTSPQAIYSSGRDLYGWLQPGAFDARPGFISSDGRSLAAIEPSEQDLGQIAIDADSVASGGGSYLVADERGSRNPLIWNIAGDMQRRLSSGITDLAWFNQGTATIGVVSHQDGAIGSRIVVTVADISRSAAYLDHRFFDPASIGSATDRRYAHPLVSADGTMFSFFVIDHRSGQVSLWLDDGADLATQVSAWNMPADRIVEPLFVASWVRSDTLLFAWSDDWQDGMPRSAVVSRMVVMPTRGVQLDEIARLDPTRGAVGVSLVELALSPDSTQLAYRLRHYGEESADRETDDTVHVAGTGDVGHAIEIERGGYGEGLTWTATGDGVIAGVRGRIALYSPDGRDLEYLSPRGVQASNPLLVGEQIWFEAHSDSGASIWRVDLE